MDLQTKFQPKRDWLCQGEIDSNDRPQADIEKHYISLLIPNAWTATGASII